MKKNKGYLNEGGSIFPEFKINIFETLEFSQKFECLLKGKWRAIRNKRSL